MNPDTSSTVALFLDRDGVINVDKGHVFRPEDVEFVEGIFELCEYFQSKNYQIFVITNQAGIARQFYTESAFHKLTQWMIDQFHRRGIKISKTYFCPHHPESRIGHLKKACLCRKPSPGMILEASREYTLNLARCVLVGDKETDIQAGRRAGVGTNILFRPEPHRSPAQSRADFEVEKLSDIPTLPIPDGHRPPYGKTDA